MANRRVACIMTAFFLVSAANMNESVSNKCVSTFAETLEVYGTTGKMRTKYLIEKQSVVSALHCQDLCLRTVNCASFDVGIPADGSPRRICRMHNQKRRSIPARYFWSRTKRPWKHYDVGSTELSKVGFHKNSS